MRRPAFTVILAVLMMTASSADAETVTRQAPYATGYKAEYCTGGNAPFASCEAHASYVAQDGHLAASVAQSGTGNTTGIAEAFVTGSSVTLSGSPSTVTITWTFHITDAALTGGILSLPPNSPNGRRSIAIAGEVREPHGGVFRWTREIVSNARGLPAEMHNQDVQYSLTFSNPGSSFTLSSGVVVIGSVIDIQPATVSVTAVATSIQVSA